MKPFNLIIIATLLISGCNKEEDNTNPNAKKVEGIYTGVLRDDISGARQYEITAKAESDNSMTISFTADEQVGKEEIRCTNLYYYETSYEHYLAFDIGTQTVGEKMKNIYEGQRIRYDVSFPPCQGYFTINTDGSIELRLIANVNTHDEREYTLIMLAQKP